MTVGLSNSAKRSRYYGQTVNQQQGGGNRKCGLPPHVAKDSWSFIYMRSSDVAGGQCLKLGQSQLTMQFSNQSRPVYSWTNGNSYWKFV
jgi:hypothetical protein